jgi:HSP20 family protein
MWSGRTTLLEERRREEETNMTEGTKRQKETPADETRRIGHDEVKKALSGLGGLGELVRNALDAAERLTENLAEFSQNGAKTDEVRANFGINVRTMSGGASARPTAPRQPSKKSSAHKGRAEMDDVREPVIDLFDEGEYLALIVELPGVAEDAIQFELHDDILVLTASASERTFQQEILLPASVRFEDRTQRLHNGVLEAKFPKRTVANG